VKFLSIYKTRDGPFPDKRGMAVMGKLIEKWMKAGVLLSAEGCMRRERARVRLSNG